MCTSPNAPLKETNNIRREREEEVEGKGEGRSAQKDYPILCFRPSTDEWTSHHQLSKFLKKLRKKSGEN
jgi:hypothetical protein